MDLSASAGKILYAIGLQVESSKDVTGYQVNLGRLTLTEQERAALHGPASVTLDEILYRTPTPPRPECTGPRWRKPPRMRFTR